MRHQDRERLWWGGERGLSQSKLWRRQSTGAQGPEAEGSGDKRRPPHTPTRLGHSLAETVGPASPTPMWVPDLPEAPPEADGQCTAGSPKRLQAGQEARKGHGIDPGGTHQTPTDLGPICHPDSPCQRCCDLLAPGLTPSAGRSGISKQTPPLGSQWARTTLVPTPAPGVGARHLVRGELDSGARARGPVLTPVGGGVEVGVGDPEFVGGPRQRWGGVD